MWIGRSVEQERLRAFFAGPAPALALVRGPAGVGRSALVRRVLPPGDRSWFTVTPLDAATQARLLRRAWWGDGESPGEVLLPPTENLATRRRPTTLVLDGVDHLADPVGVAHAVAALWQASRARGLPLHVVLVGSDSGLAGFLDQAAELAEAPALDLTVPPLSPAEIAHALPGWPAAERLAAWASFGGFPARLRHLDPGVRLGTNLQRAFLEPAGPLHQAGADLLATLFQKPERYAALLLAMARGAADWGQLRQAVPDFTSSSQLAPYLASLEQHGLVRSERSLDARPGSRNRRYRLGDPFPGSWLRLVLPALDRLDAGADPGETWREVVRPALESWLEHLFPAACQAFVRSASGGFLPAAGREVGALWGDGYELPVAGTLRNGAPLYGSCVWGRAATAADAQALDEAVRATRYGFGREARLRVLFAGGAVDHTLRRSEARNALLFVVPLEAVLGL